MFAEPLVWFAQQKPLLKNQHSKAYLHVPKQEQQKKGLFIISQYYVFINKCYFLTLGRATADPYLLGFQFAC